ncbi:MAG: SNF2 helicase associated domain-containing protein [Clostridia bacterium]|nr:SNF2 helicase associated domain-containing protein [Clostridia bacterium]
MFTRSSARSAIGNPAIFARGGAYVQEGRVTQVTVRESHALQIYEGVVHSPDKDYAVMFEYDPQQERFAACRCACPESSRSAWGCRHVAALMLAACGGAATPVGPRDGSDFMHELLISKSDSLSSVPSDEPPVRLYPQLRRVSDREMALGLRLGRSRLYIVRSMAEFAQRAQKREAAIYGRELTFSHREEELAPEDVQLFGQIVMLAGRGDTDGGELMLSGAALDQTMRLLAGRQVDIREDSGAQRRVRVVLKDIALELELEESGDSAQLCVLAQNVILGQSGAYRLTAEELICAFGETFERINGLLQVASAYPQGVRFGSGQLEEVCTRLILPAMQSTVMRKGQTILTSHTPTPVRPRLYIDMDDGKRLTCRTAFDYLGTVLTGSQTHPHIRRNLAVENDVRSAVMRLFPEKTGEDDYAFEGNDDARFALLSEQLSSLERAGEVLVSDRLARMNVKHSKTMSFGLTQEDGKLVLKADLGGYTQEELTQALAAYRQKRNYVRLNSGMFLSGDALEQAAEAAQVLDGLDMTAEQAQAGAEVPMSRAMYLESALENRENISLHAPKEIEAWTQRMRAAQSTQVQQPASLNAQLRSYQLEGLSWLCALSSAGFNGILADDMGLGKTIQALSLLLWEQEQGLDVHALVVCPASLQLNWLAEAKKFAPSLVSMSLMGSAKERLDIIQAESRPNLLITSYDQLRRDVQAYQDISFTHMLLDEAQNIKNAASQAARAVKTIQSERRFAMTGTPIENRLSELWSIFDFLMPGYLGTYKKFKDRFEAPVVRDANENARTTLHMMVAPFILRRMKKDVLTDLPEKVETVMSSEMTPEQRRIYTAYVSRLQKDGVDLLGSKDKIRMLAELTRLRQLCCDPRLCLEDYTGGSGKLMQLMEIVRDALEAGHRILLFSQFTTMLDLIAEALDNEGVDYYVLTGDTDKEERMELVQQFNEGGADVFLISLKAGGTGLNLTGADVVIHYDPWWNVSAQNQATDRAYRIGQTKGVQVIRLIASDTVEEHILNIQERKKTLSDGVLLGEENFFTMDAETLKEVLGG